MASKKAKKIPKLRAPSVKTPRIVKVKLAPISRKSFKDHFGFVSYSHKNERYIEEFKNFFKPASDISIFYDSGIEEGDEWELKIFRAIDNCKVAILFLSVAFLASEYIMNKELPRLIARVRKGEIKLYIMYVEQCLHANTIFELEKYQFVNDPDRPFKRKGVTVDERNSHYYKLSTLLIEKFLQSRHA